jgi:hypothetical protein
MLAGRLGQSLACGEGIYATATGRSYICGVVICIPSHISDGGGGGVLGLADLSSMATETSASTS